MHERDEALRFNVLRMTPNIACSDFRCGIVFKASPCVIDIPEVVGRKPDIIMLFLSR